MTDKKNKELIAARKAKGWTQEDMALRLKCTKSTISNWENFVSQPPLDVALELADLFGVDVCTLFSRHKVQESHTLTA
ncbi:MULTISPECIES: helix-turn-helix transcriptional regulator [Paenibacillus]|uniref:helix-turn-helix transcriptional regulator n=1 Tax=Paenibacillus TaxID=44249 RepID=UPI00210E3934|nr:helix-turn-helix transcriptional regulator [Paenibacillus sp. UNC496MF]